MEAMNEALTMAREELIEGKKELEKTVNEMGVLRGIIQEHLAQEIQNIRASRHAIAREGAETLVALRDLRKFFLEGDYQEEMKRLERFIATARDLKACLDDGTISAAADVMLKLSAGGKI